MAKQTKQNSEDCPCGAQNGSGVGVHYSDCCGKHHQGLAAPTAVALMRSRYCAFVMGDVAYLLATWHPQTRPASIDIDPNQRWLWLKLRGTTGGLESDTQGSVSFVARYKIAGKGYRLEENSLFEKLENRWFYLQPLDAA